MAKYDAEQRRETIRRFMDENELTMQGWCKASGLTESALRHFLAGRAQSMKDDTYEALAGGANKLLKAEWVTAALLRGATPRSGMVAIAGRVGAGQEIHSFDDSIKGAGIGETERPEGADGSIVAVEVGGSSMMPVYRDGDILFYARDEMEDWLRHVGDECVVKLTDGRYFVKILRRGHKRGHATLSSYNADDIEDVKVEWAAPIRWIRRASRYAGGALPLVRKAR